MAGFSRKQILDAAASGYGGDAISQMYDDKGNVKRGAGKMGDSLALFIVREISELMRYSTCAT